MFFCAIFRCVPLRTVEVQRPMRGRNHHHITTNMTNRWPYQLAYNNPDVSEFHTEIVAQKKAVVHEFFLLRHKNYFLALLAVARIIQSSAQQTQREIDHVDR